jgi:hypothetical protein
MSITIGQGCKQTKEKWVGSNHLVGWRCENNTHKGGTNWGYFHTNVGGGGAKVCTRERER